MIDFIFPSRHIRQQSRCHPGPVRRRLYWQRHWLQRRQRLPGYWRGVDHRGHSLAHGGQDVQGGPRKPGLLCHPVHHPGCVLCAHAAVPAAGVSGRRWAGRAADLQNIYVTVVRLTVADLHPLGFTGGLLPFNIVLNGEERGGWETHCQYEEKERERGRRRKR